jgi:hypothetical protein
VISHARQLLDRLPPHGRRCSPAATTAPRVARAAIARAPYPLTTGPEVKLFTPLPTLTVEFSPHRSSSPSPPCLGHSRPPPPILLRPHLLHPEHRPSPRDLNVHFNASLEPFSGLPLMTLPHPSTLSWRATLGEPPAAFCLKLEPPSPGVHRQDQLERFSAKREHNQHTIVQYHIIHSSKSYYNLGSRIRYTKRFEAKITLQRLIKVCGSDFSLGQDIPFCPKRECHPSAF